MGWYILALSTEVVIWYKYRKYTSEELIMLQIQQQQ